MAQRAETTVAECSLTVRPVAQKHASKQSKRDLHVFLRHILHSSGFYLISLKRHRSLATRKLLGDNVFIARRIGKGGLGGGERSTQKARHEIDGYHSSQSP